MVEALSVPVILLLAVALSQANDYIVRMTRSSTWLQARSGELLTGPIDVLPPGQLCVARRDLG